MAAGVTTSTQPNGKRAVVFINRLPTANPLPQRYTVTIPARQDELPSFPRLLPPMPQRQSLQPKPQPRPLPAAVDAEEVNPQTWRRIELLAWKADEETCDVVLLRPLWWIEQAGAKVGGLLRLAMPEMGVAGPAKVLSIGPCPSIQEGQPGTQIVTGTFKHKAKLVLHLHLKGLDKPIGVTPNHPIYSLDRGDFIPAGNLRIGERLKTRDGVATWVTKVDTIPGKQTVYNLEVHRDHVYYVSNLAVLVHNSYVLQTGGRTISSQTAKTLADELGVHPKQIGRAIERLKKSYGLPNDHHGKIWSNGDYTDADGSLIDNISSYF